MHRLAPVFLFAAFVSCSGPATKPPCGPTNCSGCCDSTGACQAGSSQQACGSGGLACAVCNGTSTCGFGVCGGAGNGAGGSGGGSTGGGGGGGGGGATGGGGGSTTGGGGGATTGGGGGSTMDGGTGGGDPCAGTLTQCGTQCLDLQANLENCGRCGHACGQGQVCNRGTCAVLPDDCTTLPQGCGAGYFCEPISKKCQMGCRLAADCPSGATCNGNTCDCGAGQHACGQACVADTSPDSCGSRCSACAQPEHSTASCASATCGFTCNTGFAPNGGACLDIDECLTNNGGCSANATCANTPGSRTCTCRAGFSGDGVTCTDVNECATNNGGCDANATCTNTPGARTCACVTGYTGDGVTCADVNECLSGNGGCNINATCTNTPGGRTCACNAGYSGNGVTCTLIATGGGGGATGGGGGATGGGGGTTGGVTGGGGGTLDAGTTTSEQIATVRAAIDAFPDGGSGSYAIRGAVVSAFKPAIAGASATNDPPGFFIQGTQAGPALFIAVDPSTIPGLAVGNLVDLTVDSASKLNGLRVVRSISGVVRSTTMPNPVPGLIAPAGSIDFATTGNLDAFESRLISFSATVSTDATAAGTSFKSVNLGTTGTQASSAVLKLRMPSTELDALAIGPGCTFQVNGVPMWRFNTTAQPSPSLANELQLVSCPGPSVLGAGATSPTSVAVTFNRDLASGTVTAGAFSISSPTAGTLSVQSASLTASRAVTLSTATQVPNARYTVTVGSSVQSLRGDGVVATANSASFDGAGAGSCTPRVVISQVYPHGGQAWSQDYVELHNRSGAATDISGWTLQYQSQGGTAWNTASLGTTIIPAGGYVLVALGTASSFGSTLAADLSGGLNLSGTAGKIALVNNSVALSGCPGSTAWVDLVSWGVTATPCAEGVSATAPLTTEALVRTDGVACVDTDSNSVDFTPVSPASPRNSGSTPVTCTCP